MRSHHDLSLFKEESLLSLDLLCTCKKFDENITQIVHDNDCAVESPHDHNVNVVLNITSVNDVPAYIVSMNVNDNEYVFHPRTLTSQAQINSFFSIPVVESCTTKLRITVKKNGNDIDSDDYKTLGGGFSLMCRMRDDPKNGHTHSMYPEKKVQVLKDLNKNRDLLFDKQNSSYYYCLGQKLSLKNPGVFINLAQNSNVNENNQFWFPLRYCDNLNMLTPNKVMMESQKCVNALNELNVLPIPLNAYTPTFKKQLVKSFTELQTLLSYLSSYKIAETQDECAAIFFTDEELDEMKSPAHSYDTVNRIRSNISSRTEMKNTINTKDNKLFRKVREIVRELSSDKLDAVGFRFMLNSPLSENMLKLLEHRSLLTEELYKPRQLLEDVNNHRAKFLTLEAIDDCLRRSFDFKHNYFSTQEIVPTQESIVPFKSRQLQQLRANNDYNSVQLSEDVYQSMHAILTQCNQFNITLKPMLNMDQLSMICNLPTNSTPSLLVQNIWRGIAMNSAVQHQEFPIARGKHFSYAGRIIIDAAERDSIQSLRELHTSILNKHPDNITVKKNLDCRMKCMKLCNEIVQCDVVHRIIPWKTGQFILNTLNSTTEQQSMDDTTNETIRANYASMQSLLEAPLQPLFAVASGAEQSIEMPSLSFMHDSFQMLPTTGYDQESLLEWNIAHMNC